MLFFPSLIPRFFNMLKHPWFFKNRGPKYCCTILLALSWVFLIFSNQNIYHTKLLADNFIRSERKIEVIHHLLLTGSHLPAESNIAALPYLFFSNLRRKYAPPPPQSCCPCNDLCPSPHPLWGHDPGVILLLELQYFYLTLPH